MHGSYYLSASFKPHGTAHGTARHERTHGTACLARLYLALNKQHNWLQTMAPFSLHLFQGPSQLKATSESE